MAAFTAWLLVGPSAHAAPTLEADEVLVGFGIADMTPPVGVPLAGYANRRAEIGQWFSGAAYARLFHPSNAVHDPIEARAMAIERDGRRLVFLRLDLVAVSRDLIAAIRARLTDLALPEDALVVTATHTHSGPGAWMDSLVWAIIGTDTYRPEIFARLAESGARAVRAALADEAPARLLVGSFAASGLQRNRRDRSQPVDDTANLILARDRDGAWRGGLLNFAIHPTALPAENLAFTADVAGAIERHVGASLTAPGGAAPTMLFLNGALGDVSPTQRGFAGIERIGEAFAKGAENALSGLRPLGAQWTVETAEAELGPPRVPLQNCLSPPWLRWIVGHDIGLRAGSIVSHAAQLRLIRFGNVALMTWPGEPTTAMGAELRHAAERAGVKQPIVVGIAGDYMAYFTSPAEFTRGKYEACMSWFGPKGGDRIVSAYRRLFFPPDR
jgi:hypothetical protein